MSESNDLARQDLTSVPMTYRTLEAICRTELVPAAYRNKPDAALAAVLYGREMGIPPMSSMSLIDVIDGKPSLSAELMNSMIRQAGHSIRVDAYGPDGCTLTGTRADTGDEATISFTIDDARRAGLAGRKNYERYPSAMMFARAISQLARVLFPDVFTTHAYTPQDLDVDAAPPAIDVPAEDAPFVIKSPAPVPVEIIEEAGTPNLEVLDAPLELELDRGVDEERDELEAALLDALGHDPDAGTMSQLEAQLRTVCALAENVDLVHGRGELDFLHTALADVGAAHVSDLRKANLVELVMSVRSTVEAAFAARIEGES